ncbi:MAG: phosphate signaling complex protein PhoU [Actinomycetia bacterium]|nr:phosphate signaling complex protein PhoU [Actinomycetes bacterium]
MRKTFHQRIDEITEDVLAMGSLAQEAVSNSVTALLKMDTQIAEKIIRDDERIDEYDISIEEKCIVLQAEHQPVAVDLRFLHSVSILIKHLERIGDLAVNIAKIVKRLSGEDEKSNIDKEIIDLLVEMGNLVKPELSQALESFKNRDAKLASKLGKSDDDVDEIQELIFKKLFSSHKGEEDIKFVTNIALASRYLERIGDQSVNIGERVMYFLTGDYSVFHDDLDRS